MTNAQNRMLVAFDSRLGSTAEVAAFIGRVLADSGQRVDVKAVSQVDDLSPYNLVLIGGAIRYDRWLLGVTKFTVAHRKTLQQVPVAFFFTCLTLANPTPDAVRKAISYAQQIRNLVPEVQPLSVGQFAGVLRFAGMPWPLRVVLRIVSLVTGVKEDDYRDWDAIRDWARGQLA